MTAERIRAAIQDIEARVIEIRHRLHRRPELGFDEYETAQLIVDTLKEVPLRITTGILGTGILAELLPLNDDSETVLSCEDERVLLIRADMDALPIQEESGLSFSSEKPGVMHACGHDGHVAILLGTALVLSRFRDEIPGTVKFMFQPAEETEGGAQGMIEAGILHEPAVDAAVGLHLWGGTERGIVEYKSGPMMASPDVFDITIKGKGGHAAMPHTCIDPVPIAATVIQQLQTIVSRQINPLDAVVISVCKIEGGSAFNVIPNEVKLQGTVRTFMPEVRERVPDLIRQILKNTTEMFGADFELDYQFRYPPVVNDPEITELVRRSACNILGTERVRELERPNMGGEDFAYLTEAVPASFFYLGIAPSPEKIVPHHHPQFMIDDSVLKDGIAVFCQIVKEFFETTKR
jgi:amidohydrolase